MPSCAFLSRESSLRRLPFRVDSSIIASSLVQQGSIDTANVLETRWFPTELLVDETDSDARWKLEEQSLELMSNLLAQSLQSEKDLSDAHECRIHPLASGRFVDLCGTEEGERRLEGLFDVASTANVDDNVLLGAVTALQSVIVIGLQFGVRASPEQFERSTAHLADPLDDPENTHRDFRIWDSSSSRRLKYENDKVPGHQLLAKFKWKRTAQGAYDLLVKIGAWNKHEDLALLRSGFSLRFSKAELKAAEHAANSQLDVDADLGIRVDMRHHKVFTIDGSSTTEIDDGLSVEELHSDDDASRKRYRYWIHIADCTRWAPHGSALFEIGKKRATSLYLPYGSIPMFPHAVSSGVMSLTPNSDVCALSLGVELNEDGSIDPESLVVTPSLIRVQYRLSYDDADEMLEEGIGYNEEWELGELFTTAQRRRDFRIRNGSAEGFVPTQIPQYSLKTFADPTATDGIGISHTVSVSHNGGKNQSATVDPDKSASESSAEAPVSSSSILVTELMILAGEAIGRWKMLLDEKKMLDDASPLPQECVRLPFRSQPKPDYRSREREQDIMMDLLSNDVGGGYCHAWYARRFLSPVVVDEAPNSHSGLGLPYYVQWTSPIRRFADLQVHVAVKRYLRRQRVVELLMSGQEVPSSLSDHDLGCSLDKLAMIRSDKQNKPLEIDNDIDYSMRNGVLRASRMLQRECTRYWMLEYAKRLRNRDPGRVFQALVLGCTNPARRIYAVYIYELGLEWKYTSPVGTLQAGIKLYLSIGSVFPQNGQLTFVRAKP